MVKIMIIIIEMEIFNVNYIIQIDDDCNAILKIHKHHLLKNVIIRSVKLLMIKMKFIQEGYRNYNVSKRIR